MVAIGTVRWRRRRTMALAGGATSAASGCVACTVLATITTVALLSTTPQSLVHAFSHPPSSQRTLSIATSQSRHSMSVTTQLAALQPTKGGIVVEAKSDFVARDVLIDAMMGRSDGDSADGEQQQAAATNDGDVDEFAPNENLWVFTPSKSRGGQQQQQQPINQAVQSTTTNNQQQQQSINMPVPPQSPPPPAILTQQQQSYQQQSPQSQPQPPPTATSSSSQSKLPDPSLMKLKDIQGELALRRISYDDCFDRTSLENKLRDGRSAMKLAGSMEKNSRRNVSSGSGSVAGVTMPDIRQSAQRRGASSRASAAEQAIFTSSTTNYAASSSARASPPQQQQRKTATPSRTSARNASSSSSRNPFSRSNNSRQQQQSRGGGNSSSNFRDNAHGIGFGDVNSYSSSGRSGGGGGNSGGAGVRLGKSRTSYGDFGGAGGGATIGGEFGNPNPSSGNAVGGVGGSSASFRNGASSSGMGRGSSGGESGRMSGGGSTTTFSSGGGGSNFGGGGPSPSSSFSAGGVSIKGDSSIFSSMGSIGQGGSTTVFSGGGSSGGAGMQSAPVPPPPRATAPPPPSQPAASDVQLDWLTQDSPSSFDASPSPPAVDPEMSYASSSSYENYGTSDSGIINESTTTVDIHSYSPTDKRISQQYLEQGLDIFSGGQVGFGAVQGEERTGGDASHRGREEDVKVQGKVGDMGVSMGGNFGSTGSDVGGFGGGSSRSSARYSSGMGVGGMEYED